MSNDIQKLMDNLLQERVKVREAQRQEFGAEMEVRRALSKRLQVAELGFRAPNSHPPCAAAIEIGHWDCDSSPIGICAYDGYEDPMQDNCLYCNYPEERK